MATVEKSGRARFNAWLRGEMVAGSVKKLFPDEGSMYDYAWDINKGRWVEWMRTVDEYEHDVRLEFSEIVVPTKDSVCYTYLLDKLVTHGSNVLMCGQTGTGKSINILQYLQKGMAANYVPMTLSFSPRPRRIRHRTSSTPSSTSERKACMGRPRGRRMSSSSTI